MYQPFLLFRQSSEDFISASLNILYIEFMKKNTASSIGQNTVYLLLLMICFSCRNEPTADLTGSARQYRLTYYKNGIVATKAQYKDGKRDGISYNYYPTSELKSRVNYLNGKKDGVSINYYKNGKVKAEINYADNKREGEAKYYHQDGSLFRRSYYRNDELNGIREKFYKGGLTSHTRYLNGFPQPGLREYTLDGKEIENCNNMNYSYEDHRDKGFEVIIRLQFDDQNVNDRFFLRHTEGEDSIVLEPLYYNDGEAIIREYAEPDRPFRKQYNIVGIHTTARKNPLVQTLDFTIELKK